MKSLTNKENGRTGRIVVLDKLIIMDNAVVPTMTISFLSRIGNTAFEFFFWQDCGPMVTLREPSLSPDREDTRLGDLESLRFD